MSSLPVLSILLGRGPAGDAPAVGSRKRLDAVAAAGGETFADALEQARTDRPTLSSAVRRTRAATSRSAKPGPKPRPAAPGRDVAERHRSTAVRSTPSDAPVAGALVTPDATGDDATTKAAADERRAAPATRAIPATPGARTADEQAATPASRAVPAIPAARADQATAPADAEAGAAPVVTPTAGEPGVGIAPPAAPTISPAALAAADPGATIGPSQAARGDLAPAAAVRPDLVPGDAPAIAADRNRHDSGDTLTVSPGASGPTGPVASGGTGDASGASAGDDRSAADGGRSGADGGAAWGASPDGAIAPTSGRTTRRGADAGTAGAVDATTTGPTPAGPAGGRLAVHGTERAAEAIATAAADGTDAGAADRVLGQVVDRLRSFSTDGTPGLATRFDDPDLGMIQLVVSGKAGDTIRAELVTTDARSAEAIGRAIERAMATNIGLHGISLAVRTAHAAGSGPDGQQGSRQDDRPRGESNAAFGNHNGAPTGDAGRNGSDPDRSFAALSGIDPVPGARRRPSPTTQRSISIDALGRPAGRPGVDVRA